MKRLLLILFIILAGCQTTFFSDLVGSGRSADLVGTSWKVTTLNGQSLLSDSTITLQIEANRVKGNATCNSYFTSDIIIFEGGEIDIKEFARATLLSCGKALDEQESVYLHTFAEAVSYQIVGEQLQILDESGNVIIELIPITQ